MPVPLATGEPASGEGERERRGGNNIRRERRRMDRCREAKNERELETEA